MGRARLDARVGAGRRGGHGKEGWVGTVCWRSEKFGSDSLGKRELSSVLEQGMRSEKEKFGKDKSNVCEWWLEVHQSREVREK